MNSVIHHNMVVWRDIKPLPPRKAEQVNKRARRMIFEMKRPTVFKPGPYCDGHGNARFLGRES